MKIIIFVILTYAFQTFAGYRVKKIIQKNKSTIVGATYVDMAVPKRVVLRHIREFINEREATPKNIYHEELIPDDEVSENLKMYSQKSMYTPEFIGSEVREIIKQGPDSNRIILTVLGDGYTENEKEKFFSDVKRIVGDLFTEITFKSYLKLFNVYAIFVPSKDSGISDFTDKDTAFGLYRSPRGSKRGIMPGNKNAIEKALNLIPAYTDYPVIIANDDFYGGLGGRYAITSRSVNSGSMVLRHELGHNFSNVGEEYDGGQVYSGANFSNSENVPWTHWLTNRVEVHRAKFLTGSYVWQDLTNNDFTKNFNFPYKEDYFYSLELSSVGWEFKDDVKVFLDNQKLNLLGVYTEDRSFFQTEAIKLKEGQHELKIEDHSHDGNNVLAFANGYAFPKTYNFQKGVIGAFNVFDSNGDERGFRPTHADCLMRDMRSMVFCPVDQENIWLRFFNKVNLIEKVNIRNDEIELSLLDFKNIKVKWYKKPFWGNAEELTKLEGMLTVKKSDLGKGKFIVEAIFDNPEVRKKKIQTQREFKL